MDFRADIVTRSACSYGIASEGAAMKYVVAAIPGHGVKVVASTPGEVPREAIEKLAAKHAGLAKSILIKEIHSRYMDDVLGYVKSLPRGRRWEQLFSQDPEASAMAEDAVADALVKALAEDDAFRAAVAFDQQTPFLRADRRVVDLMDRIVADADMMWASDESRYLTHMADIMEAKIVERAPMLAERIERAKLSATHRNMALAV